MATKTQPTKAQIEQAYNLGKETALDAATWIADGNTSQGAILTMLSLIEDGDPRFWDCVSVPGLSGENADDMSPNKLFADIIGGDIYERDPEGELCQELCDAYENGVNAHFESACEVELRKWVSE
jgi:hypothetical protein